MMELIRAIQGSEAVYRLGWTLLHTVWQGAAVAALLALGFWILRRRSASARYLAACVALAMMVALPVGTFLLVPGPVRAGPLGGAEMATPTTDPLGVLVVSPERPLRPVEGVPGATPADVTPSAPVVVGDSGVATSATPLPERAARALTPVLPWVVLAWAAGVLALSLWQLGGWIAARRLRKLAVEPADGELAGKVARLARELHVSRPVRVLESMLVRVPAVLGWIWPAILLPAGLATGLSPRQLEAILVHELAHIRRYDYLVNLLQTLVETALFYHPGVWFVSRRIRAERENCCDDIAVAAGAERFSYAESLVHIAQRSVAGRRAGRLVSRTAVGAMGRRSELRWRIGRLIGAEAETTRLARSWPIAAVLLIALVIGAAVIENAKAQLAQESGQAVEGVQVSKDSGAGGTRAAELPRTPRNSPEALRDFGVEKSEPIESGFFFYGGKYVEMPYVVERRGLDIFINGHCVRPGPEYPPFEYDVSEDPGDPPPGSSPFDPRPEGTDRRNTYWARKSAYLRAHYDHSAYVEKMIETYLKSTDVTSVEPDPIIGYIVTLKDGRTKKVDFGGRTQSGPRDKGIYLKNANRGMEHFEGKLRGRSLFLIMGGTEWGLGRRSALGVVEALLSSEDPEVRLEDLEKAGFVPRSDKAFWQVIATEFEPSEQLKARYEAMKAGGSKGTETEGIHRGEAVEHEGNRISAAGGKPTRTIVTWDGRKMVVYDRERLAFYDGLGEDARAIAEVPCKHTAIAPSIQGKYVALLSQHIKRQSHVEIYDSNGKQLGVFDLDGAWGLIGVSDSGDLVALSRHMGEDSPFLMRLCDFKGNVVRDYDTRPTYLRFASDGAALVWGAKEGSGNSFVSVLDGRGAEIAGFQHPNAEIWIRNVGASANASIVVLLECPWGEHSADRVTIWNTEKGSRTTVRLATELGAIQLVPSVSPQGAVAAVRVGVTGVCLIQTSTGSVVLATRLQPSLPAERAVTKVRKVSPSDDGSFSATCVITAPGEEDSTEVLRFDAQGRLVNDVSDAKTIEMSSIPSQAESTVAGTGESGQVIGLEKPPVAVEQPWGEAVEGVQVRLRADKTVWQMGEVPTFKVDVRSSGGRDLLAVLTPRYEEIELDGEWHGSSSRRDKERVLPLGHPAQYNDLEFALGEWDHWIGKSHYRSLRFDRGRHVIRVALLTQLGERETGTPVRAVSNPVEIEILPAPEVSFPFQEPIQVREAYMYWDGGTRGLVFTDARGKKLSMCSDGRMGRMTPWGFYVFATHPDREGAQLVPADSAVERAIVQALRNWLNAEFTASEREAMAMGLRRRVEGLNQKQRRGLSVLHCLDVYERIRVQSREQPAIGESSAAGRVVDMEGGPVSGATVTFRKTEEIVGPDGSRTWQSRTIATVQTDEKGGYSTPTMRAGEKLSVSIEAPGYVPRDDPEVVRSQDGTYSPEGLVFGLKRPGAIEGRVLGRDGKPLAGAPLSLTTYVSYPHYGSVTANHLRAITDEEGRFRMEGVPPGKHLLSYPWMGPIGREIGSGRWSKFTKPGERSPSAPISGVCGATVVSVRDGEEVKDVILDLSQSTCVAEGRVSDTGGRPVAGARVSLYWKEAFGATTVRGEGYPPAVTDAEGHYRLENLPAGRWHLMARHDRTEQWVEPVRVTLTAGSVTRQDLQLRGVIATSAAPEEATKPSTQPATSGADESGAGEAVEAGAVQGAVAKGQPLSPELRYLATPFDVGEELQAIGFKTFWLPDGSLASAADTSRLRELFHVPGGSRNGTDARYVAFLVVYPPYQKDPLGALPFGDVQLTDHEGNALPRWIDRAEVFPSEKLENLAWMMFVFRLKRAPAPPDAVDVRLTYSRGGEWDLHASFPAGARGALYGGLEVRDGGESAAGGAYITIARDIERTGGMEFRIVPVVKEGRQPELKTQWVTQRRGDKIFQTLRCGPGVPLDAISEFQFYRRSLRTHAVTYRNVSLEPGHKTDVAVKGLEYVLGPSIDEILKQELGPDGASSEGKTRESAIKSYASKAGRKAVPLLLQLLASERREDRRASEAALGNLAQPADIPTFREIAITSGDRDAGACTRLIVALYAPEADKALADIATEAQWSEARRRALQALGRRGSKGATPDLLDYYPKAPANQRPEIIETLAEIWDVGVGGPKALRPDPASLAKTPEERQYAEAVKAFVLKALESEDRDVRGEAVDAAAALGLYEAIPIIERLDEMELKRAIGARALARLGSEDACAALTRMLRTPCTDSRARSYGEIIRVLADKNYSAAVPVMIMLLDDTRETGAGGRTICSWAMYALAEFDPDGPDYWDFMGKFPKGDPRNSGGQDLMREAWKTYLKIKEKGGPAKAEPESVARLAKTLLQLVELRQEARYKGRPGKSMPWVVKAQALIPLAPAEQQKDLSSKAGALLEKLTQ